MAANGYFGLLGYWEANPRSVNHEVRPPSAGVGRALLLAGRVGVREVLAGLGGGFRGWGVAVGFREDVGWQIGITKPIPSCSRFPCP